MNKKNLSIVGILCLSLGLLMATGVPQNMWQGVCAVVLLGAASWALNRADRMGVAEKSASKAKREKLASYRDAA